ncbi:MAG TPA: MFS transporter [Dehalococcoidia bacterium]|nr:MFS transporter [Dehalococcoidia bacterium]
MTRAIPGFVTWKRPKIFYGWWIVVISALDDALKHGTFNRGFTLYVVPIRAELGIGVAAISLADMLGRLEGGLLGPVMGFFTDRLGPRVMLAFGGIMSGGGFILLGLTGSYLSFMLVFVGFLSVGFRSGYNNATVAALNNWFRRRRGLAMSFASIGNGLGGAFLAPVMGLLVVALGWRTSALISGILILAIVVPLSLLVRRSPESMGLLPDGASPDEPGGVGNGPEHRGGGHGGRHGARSFGDVDFTAREAARTPTFWWIVVSVGLRNTVHSGLSFLLAPVMVWYLQGNGRGDKESLAIATGLVGLLGLSAIVFNPAVGWLSDKWSKQKISALCMLSGVLALSVLLDRSGRWWQLIPFVVLLALSESANPLAWAIIGDFFGRKSFATLRGWQHLPDQLMSMSTPVWMGLIYDRTQSYFLALIPLVVLYCLAAGGYWTMPRPKIPARLRALEEAAPAGASER